MAGVDHLRAQARNCRRLAEQTVDRGAAAKLLDVARQFEAEASEADALAKGTEPQPPRSVS